MSQRFYIYSTLLSSSRVTMRKLRCRRKGKIDGSIRIQTFDTYFNTIINLLLPKSSNLLGKAHNDTYNVIYSHMQTNLIRTCDLLFGKYGTNRHASSKFSLSLPCTHVHVPILAWNHFEIY